jgi:hypothetical protein
MLPTRFQFIWLSGFIGEDYLGIDQSAARIHSAGHFCLRIETSRLSVVVRRRRPSVNSLHFNLLLSNPLAQ